uniref:Uncharacterized protein n=1 Tax=Romanomermis culicivorax TaxID=13658 RepID=A0A915HYF5_ROMCU
MTISGACSLKTNSVRDGSLSKPTDLSALKLRKFVAMYDDFFDGVAIGCSSLKTSSVFDGSLSFCDTTEQQDLKDTICITGGARQAKNFDFSLEIAGVREFIGEYLVVSSLNLVDGWADNLSSTACRLIKKCHKLSLIGGCADGSFSKIASSRTRSPFLLVVAAETLDENGPPDKKAIVLRARNC